MKKRNRLVSIFVVCLMLCSFVFPLAVHADEADTTEPDAVTDAAMETTEEVGTTEKTEPETPAADTETASKEETKPETDAENTAPEADAKTEDVVPAAAEEDGKAKEGIKTRDAGVSYAEINIHFQNKEGTRVEGLKYRLYRISSGVKEYYVNSPEDRGSPAQWGTLEQAEELISDDFGLMLLGFAAGTYYLEETDSGEFYLPEERPFEIVITQRNLDEIPAYTFEHTIIKNYKPGVKPIKNYKVRLILTDVDGKPIKGAHFVFYRINADGTKEYAEAAGSCTFSMNTDAKTAGHFETDENGEIWIGLVPEGTFYFQQVKALDGYVLDKTPIEIKIAYETGDVTKVVVNQKIGPVNTSTNPVKSTGKTTNPKTSDVSVLPIFAILLLSGSAAGIFLFCARKRRNHR